MVNKDEYIITRNRDGELCGASNCRPLLSYSVWFSDGVLRSLTTNEIAVFEHITYRG